MTETTTASLSETGYCGECGGEAFFKGAGLCYGCASYEQVGGVATAMHLMILNVMRGKDRHEAVRVLNLDAERAEAALTAARDATAPLENATTGAVSAERAAADAARDAAAHHRKRARELRRAERDGADADTHDELAWKAAKASRDAQARGEEHEATIAALRDAEAALAAHQAKVQGLEDAATAARRAADNPPAEVPVSIQTAFNVRPFTVAMHVNLDDENDMAAGGLRAQVELAARLTGLDERYIAQGRREGREAEKKDAASRPGMAADAHGNLTVTGPSTRFLRARG